MSFLSLKKRFFVTLKPMVKFFLAIVTARQRWHTIIVRMILPGVSPPLNHHQWKNLDFVEQGHCSVLQYTK